MSHPAGEPIAKLANAGAASGGRLATLDILRGLALLGMILAHCHKMMAAVPASLAENPVGWIVVMFVAEKDRAIFAFLFGVSFAVMMRRIEARNLPVVPIFLRRLAVLYAIGFFVEAFTRFHILREYAFWGVALLFLRNHPTRTLLWVAALSAAAFSIRDLADSCYSIATHGMEATVTQEAGQLQTWQAAVAEREHLLAQPHYAEVVRLRVGSMLADLVGLQWLIPGVYLALFILGLLAIRHGIFTETLKHRRLLIGGGLAGMLCWIIARWVLPLVPADLITPRIGYRLSSGLGLLDEQFLAFTWIGAVTLLLALRPALAGFASTLGWVGRMALTNYILHAAVIEFACASYGLNLKFGMIAGLLFAAALFLILALLSKVWLTRFRYGPIEWAWRSLTYWQLQPIMRDRGNVQVAANE